MHIAILGPIGSESVKDLLPTSGQLPAGYGGAPFLATLIRELLKKGHRVSAITTDSSIPVIRGRFVSAKHDRFSLYFVGARAHSIRPNGRFPGRVVDHFSVERASLCAALQDARPDCVHAHWAYEFALAALHYSRRAVVTCHDSPRQVLRFTPNLYRLGRYWMAWRALRRACFVTAVSPYLAEEVGSMCRAEITVIPNPRPLTDSGTRPKAFNGDQPTFGAVLNGWDRRKNAAVLIRAFAIVRAQKPESRLLMIGTDFEEGGIAQKWASSNGLEDGIEFVGRISFGTLMTRYREMDALVHPALEECCCMTIIEAMSLGIPVIGGEGSGGVPWQLAQGNAGILTDVRVPEALAEAMISLCQHPERAAQLSMAGLDRSREVFGAEKVASAYESIYQETLVTPLTSRRLT